MAQLSRLGRPSGKAAEWWRRQRTLLPQYQQLAGVLPHPPAPSPPPWGPKESMKWAPRWHGSSVLTVQFKAALANTTGTSHTWLLKFKLIQIKVKLYFLACTSHISRAQQAPWDEWPPHWTVLIQNISTIPESSIKQYWSRNNRVGCLQRPVREKKEKRENTHSWWRCDKMALLHSRAENINLIHF